MADSSKKMQIVFASAECAPFVKTGGLGDVAGSLPAALVRAGAEVIVMVPKYATIKDEYKAQMEHFSDFYVSLGWRNEYCGLEKLEHDGVTYMFIDNERYFARDYPYGFFDDGERFAFFSKAITESLQHLPAGFECDILHCNDWQTALIPLLLRTEYHAAFPNTKSVFTIHNIEYQGKYGADTVEDLFGLNRGDWYESGVLQMDGCVNLMKGAMVTADAVTTVSPTYAAQLRESAYAAGLDSVVRSIQWKFSGVLNGIDMVSYDPECDPDLPARYTAAEPEGKTLCKAALQQELGLAQEEGTPVLSMVTRLVGHKGVDLVCQALDGIMATGCQLVVLGRGESRYEDFFRGKAWEYGGRLSAQITYAARNSDFDGFAINEGDYLALLDGKLFGTERDITSLLTRLAALAAEREAAFVTLFYGEGVSQEEAEAAQALFTEACPETEISLLSGGQPVYYYTISIE